jgi:hypothetical protein
MSLASSEAVLPSCISAIGEFLTGSFLSAALDPHHQRPSANRSNTGHEAYLLRLFNMAGQVSPEIGFLYQRCVLITNAVPLNNHTLTCTVIEHPATEQLPSYAEQHVSCLQHTTFVESHQA